MVQLPWVYLNCFNAHLLHLKLIKDKFQGAWFFFNGFFTHLLCLKMIRNIF